MASHIVWPDGEVVERCAVERRLEHWLKSLCKNH